MDPCLGSDTVHTDQRNLHMNQIDKKNQKPLFKNGILFFSKEAERKFFFILTMIMLILGLVYKWI